MADPVVIVQPPAGNVVIAGPSSATDVVVQRSVPVITAAAQGATGPPGAAGGVYTHVQATPASTWTVVHGLGFNPNVTVVDSTGRVVEGDVEYVDISTVRLTFNGAFSGAAYLS